jgi:ankyrin repeat protein
VNKHKNQLITIKMKHIILAAILIIILPTFIFSQNEDINQLDTNGNTKLIAATMQQNLFAFNSLLAAGADVNVKSKSNDYTALHYAAACKTYTSDLIHNGGPHEKTIPIGITMVKALLKAGADVNAVSDGGTTALFLAAGITAPEITELLQILLDANADLNPIKGYRHFPLEAAIKEGNEKNARLLLDKGGDFSSLNVDKLGMLSRCLKNGFSFDFLKALHAKGADLTVKNEIKETALFFATLYNRGNPDIVSYLIANGVDVNAQDHNGFTAFSNNFSGSWANLPVIDIFMKAKVDLNIRNFKKKNMLHLLVESGISDTLTFCNLIKLFVDAGADVNAVDVDGCTPLMSFINNNNMLPAIQMLIDAGTNLNIFDNRDQNALNYTIKEPPFSAISTDPTVVMSVLQKTDSVRNTWSPLIWASEAGELEILRLLIKKGANIHAVSNDRYSNFSTPLIYAANAGHTEVVKLLIQNKVNVNTTGKFKRVTPLMFAAANGHVDVVNALLAAKANINLTNISGYTAASYAILNNQEETAKILITASKANPTALGQLLLDAARIDKPNIVKLLIDYKANVNIKRKDDAYTPLLVAVHEGLIENVKLLIAANADINYKAPNGNTPLSAAREMNFQEIAELLEQAGAK